MLLAGFSANLQAKVWDVDSLKATFHYAYGSWESITLEQSLDRCESEYAPLYDKGSVRIAVFAGYSDDDYGYVTDQAAIRALSENLVLPCGDKEIAICGFQALDSQGMKLRKDVNYNGRTVRVELDLHYSSISAKDAENVGRTAQQERSERKREAFKQALQTADVILYDGHSRDGGGPDFFPPKRFANGHVDYSWYHRNKPGLKDLKEGLKKREGSPFYIGIFACLTKRWFGHHLEALAPEARLALTTELVDETQTYRAMLTGLDGILNRRCEKGVKARLRGLKTAIF